MATLTSRKREPYVPLTCRSCSSEIEFLPPTPLPAPGSKVKCCICGTLLDLPTPGTSADAKSSTSNGPVKKAPAKRRIGTDAVPLDTEYYEILGVDTQATDKEIKSAYRLLAIKLHPDKNIDDPEAEEKFKRLALAYTTLSDPVTRHRYNEFGSQSQQQEEGFVDPEAVFSQLFGGERFADIIGTISLGQEMKSALQQTEEEEETKENGAPKKKKELTLEERRRKLETERQNMERRAQVRAKRVSELEQKLLHKLAIYTEQEPHPDVDRSVRQIWKIEAEELKQESYGVELLHAVGNVYMAKARHFAASNNTPLGVGGWFHGIRTTAHVFSETVSTLRSAYELTDVFKEINAAEAKGLTAEQKKVLEDTAAKKAMVALFKGAKLEVESIIREVCDRVLEAKLPAHTLARRATGLEILGEVYTAVRKDDSDDSDYVRIDKRPPVPPARPVPPVPPRPAPAPGGPPPPATQYRPYVPQRQA